jgi:anti-sigma factor RsiW
MNCEHYQEAIGELVDGARMDEARRIDVEAHLRDCASCRALLADLRQIRAAAARLPMAPPPERVWAKVFAQLPIPAGRPATPEKPGLLAVVFGSGRLRLAWGAAALAVAVLAFVVVALPRLRSTDTRQVASGTAAPTPPTEPVHATDAQLVQSVESELRLAEQHYEKAIAGLEQIAKAGQGTLDPQLAGTLQKNLAVIDQAIHDSRVALQTQPTNELAQESLFEAFRRKVGLLQETVSLMNEMRKGNQTEAAKIIGNMNKS